MKQSTGCANFGGRMSKIIPNEEVSRRKCLDCSYDGGELAQQDSCQECGNRYAPNQNGAGECCSECGSPHYDNHCPECDSTQILYWDDYQEMLKEE